MILTDMRKMINSMILSDMRKWSINCTNWYEKMINFIVLIDMRKWSVLKFW